MKALRELGEFNFILTELVGYRIEVFPVLGIWTVVDRVASAARLPALEPQLGHFANWDGEQVTQLPLWITFLIYRMKTITGVLGRAVAPI